MYKSHLIETKKKKKKKENVSQTAHMYEHVDSGVRRTLQVSPQGQRTPLKPFEKILVFMHLQCAPLLLAHPLTSTLKHRR